jgi:predicted MPP superfamily phosphohydrolase
MRMQFFLFLATFELLVLFLHGFVGALLIELFPKLLPYETVLGSTFFVLGWLFLLTTLITARYYHWITRVAYYISSVWMGFFFYYIFAGFFYVLTETFGYGAVDATHLVFYGRVFFLIATLISCYGLFNARRIQATHVDISLPHVPEVWKGRVMVYISDIHLGQIIGVSFAKKLVQKINDIHPDIVCVGGDLYDGAEVPKELVIAPFKALTPPLGVYFSTGNHEEYADVQKYLSSIRGAGMHVLANQKVEIDGVQLVGVDYRDTIKKKAFIKILENLSIDPARPSILLKHTPRDIAVSRDAGISLHISGHTHKGQMFPLSFITRSMYKGYDYGLKKFGALYVYTSSGVGTWGTPMRVGTRAEIVVFHFV